MKKIFFVIYIILSIAPLSKAETEVTYISSEGIYINSGTNASLSKGDTLLIYRGDEKIATVVIENISTRSSACRLLEKSKDIILGDVIRLTSGTPVVVSQKPDVPKVPINNLKEELKPESDINDIRGYIAFQQYYQKDFTSSSLSLYQPSVKTKFKIDNINGSNLTFQMKHRSRLYHRSQQITVNGDKNEWSHRIYEFVVHPTSRSGSFDWSIGRQSVYQARGVGYIDGLYLSKRLNDKFSVGSAFGGEPDYLNQKIDFSRTKASLFINYSQGDYEHGKFTLSSAITGSYLSGEINREFLSFTADYYSSKFSLNQSVEIDLYRSWRNEAMGKSLELTNYYGRVNYNLSDKIRVNVAYDNRRQIRYNYDVYIADTLFDVSDHQGLRFGTSVKLSKTITFTGNTGIRFRSDGLDNNYFANGGLNLLRFPSKQNSLSMRFAYVNTMFSNAYRPSLSIRFPVFTKVRLALTGASNIYKTGSTTTTNSYIDLSSYYTVSRDYFISGSLRQYLDSELQSSQLYFELGRNF